MKKTVLRAALVVTFVALLSSCADGDGTLSQRTSKPTVKQGQSQSVWVALESAHEIVRVDLGRREVTKRRAVPGAPHNLSISPSGNTIATTLWSDGSIVVRHDCVHRRVSLGGAPHDVKMSGGRVVVANQTEARLDVVSPEGKFRRSIALKADPHDLALRWGGRQAWVSLEGSGDLAVVGLRTGKVHYVSTGQAPHDLLFAPDGKLWVSDWEGAIHVLSNRGRLVKTIPIGVEAHHLDFTPEGDQVWITDHAARRVFVIDTSSYSVRKRLKIGGSPHHVAITADGNLAVVADHDRGILIVYKVDELQRAFAIEVGAGPHGIWAVP